MQPTPNDSHIIIFNWYIDVEPETFKFIRSPLFVFRDRLETRRSGSKDVSDASRNDFGASLSRAKNTYMSSLQ